jgi:hypothetical protein
MPTWFGEVAIVAHVLTQFGLLKAIQERVRLARGRFGQYEVIDFVVVLIGYALSGEPTLRAFYERLCPFAHPFMALFGRETLPHRATLSRFLAALDRPSVEALRQLFQEDLVARSPFACPPGGVWDRVGKHWVVVDVDGTREVARQRALPNLPDLPTPHRRFDQVCAPGYLGRKRGEVVRTRTTVLQAHTHQWLGTFGGAGNGDYRGELLHARAVIASYATSLSLPLSQVVVRLDGLYGNAAPLADLLTPDGLGVVVRGKDYALLELPAVQARLQKPPDQQTMHPESGTSRALFDCLDIPLTPTGPVVRMILATHPASASPPPVGVMRDGTVYEQFFTTVPPASFTPADILDLYLHRGSFETVLADEDQEQDPDRWCSHTPSGQECWQILSQWVWNLRLELGQHCSPTTMRLTEFTLLQVVEAPQTIASQVVAPPQTIASQVVAPPQVVAPVSYGPPQWARRSYTKGFAGAAFSAQPDGTLLCPAGHPLYPQERRPERDGSLRLLYAARLCHCRPCLLREQCQESGMATVKPRRVSAVFWPMGSSSLGEQGVPSPPPLSVGEAQSLSGETASSPEPRPVLWGDWERCQIRRRWLKVVRTETVLLTMGPAHMEEQTDARAEQMLTRAQRAHWRLRWDERLERNARSSTAPPLEVTIHGLPAAFARSFGFALLAAA